MKSLFTITSVLFLLFLPFWAWATPGIPHQFYGSVNFSNGPAPDGLVVEARIGGEMVASTSIVNGQYGFSPNLFFVTDPNNNRANKYISFFVSGIDTDRKVSFVNGGYSPVNLTIAGSVGAIEWGEDEVIDKIVAIAPSTSAYAYIKIGESLNLTISSEVSTNATINKIEKLTSSFFTGSMAVIAGNNLLNAFEIDITGDDLNISVTINYDDTDIDESSIKPYKFDGTSWVPIDNYSQNTSLNAITFSLPQAQTPYAVFGQSPPPAEETITPPAGGGSGGTPPAPPVTPIPLSEAAKKMDTNQDDKIDILDFNSLMVNWGREESSNIADFDDNGLVDIFDFNLLMIYWTG